MLLHLQKKRGTKYFPDVLNYLNNEKSQNFKKMHPATLNKIELLENLY